MSMIVLPYPRAYVDWIIPRRPDGTAVVSALNENDYDLYLNWLADYLYETDLPLPESQRDVSASLFQLAENLSLDWMNLEHLERHIKEGGSFAEWHKTEVEGFESLGDDEKDLWLESSSSGGPEFLTEAEFNRIAKEVEEASSVPESIQHLDIPYRALISRILKKIPRHRERVAELDRFSATSTKTFQSEPT
ncbi:MAG: hypothetical protein IJ678_05590 [Kiritimatiellae bacterium]|nr:hypothetical protein [Kiritimatiellia bacterium]